VIPAWWYISNNFGDNLNHYLIKAISGQPVYYTERNKPHNIVCGSILHECNEWSTVWGAGFGNEGQRVNTKYADIRAVRGKLSRNILGIDCPIGDPALLLPRYFKPKCHCAHKSLSIIPHYAHYKEIYERYAHEYNIIDPFSSVDDMVQQILCSSYVISSSLHGLIVADAYGIPNAWLKYGDEFKYRDYYSTTKQPKEPIDTIDFSKCFVSEYAHSLDDLLSVCPFYG
jgi:pyruvyltransferase